MMSAEINVVVIHSWDVIHGDDIGSRSSIVDLE